MVIIALAAPVAVAGLAITAVFVALSCPALLLPYLLPSREPPPGRTPEEVKLVAQEKKIAEERSQNMMALRENVEERTVLCPGQTTDQVLSGMWKVVEARGLHPEPARFENRPALEVTSEPSLWLRAYVEAPGQIGSPVLLTVEVGALTPEQAKQCVESIVSAFSEQSGIPRKDLREVEAKSPQPVESPSP